MVQQVLAGRARRPAVSTALVGGIVIWCGPVQSQGEPDSTAATTARQYTAGPPVSTGLDQGLVEPLTVSHGHVLPASRVAGRAGQGLLVLVRVRERLLCRPPRSPRSHPEESADLQCGVVVGAQVGTQHLGEETDTSTFGRACEVDDLGAGGAPRPPGRRIERWGARLRRWRWLRIASPQMSQIEVAVGSSGVGFMVGSGSVGSAQRVSRASASVVSSRQRWQAGHGQVRASCGPGSA